MNANNNAKKSLSDLLFYAKIYCEILAKIEVTKALQEFAIECGASKLSAEYQAQLDDLVCRKVSIAKLEVEAI